MRWLKVFILTKCLTLVTVLARCRAIALAEDTLGPWLLDARGPMARSLSSWHSLSFHYSNR